MKTQYFYDCSYIESQFTDTVIGYVTAIFEDKTRTIIFESSLNTPLALPFLNLKLYADSTTLVDSLIGVYKKKMSIQSGWKIYTHYVGIENYESVAADFKAFSKGPLVAYDRHTLIFNLNGSKKPKYFCYLKTNTSSMPIICGMMYDWEQQRLFVGARIRHKSYIEILVGNNFTGVPASHENREVHGAYRMAFDVSHENFHAGICNIVKSEWMIHRTGSLSMDYRPNGDHMTRISYL